MIRRFPLLLVLAAAGCGDAAPGPESAPSTQAGASYALEDFQSITLERTGCYGFCPTYQVTIHADGLVVYEGYEHVGVSGEKRGQVDEAGLRELLGLCESIDFWTLAERYEYKTDAEGNQITITDQPWRYTTLRVGGVEKRVENYFGGPELLRKLEDRIDALSGAAVWKQREQG